MKLPLALASIAVLAVAPVPGAPPALQEDDGIWVDEYKKESLDRIAKAADAKDWKLVFDEYAKALSPKNRSKLVRPDPQVAVWRSVVEHLNREFMKLPAEAFEHYRLENDGKARSIWTSARETNDRARIEQLVEDYFFSEITGEALDWLASRAFEEHRPQEAVHYWRKLLEQYPDPKVPRAVLAARVAMAAQAWPNEAALKDVRRHVEEKKISGRVLAGGRDVELTDFLKTLEVRAAAAAGPLRLPTVPERGTAWRSPTAPPDIGVQRGSFLLSSGSAQRPGQAPVMRGRNEMGPAPADYPYIADYARIGNREVVAFTNGLRITAISPAHTRNDPKGREPGVYWRFPAEDIKRAERPQQVGYSLPLIGATLDGEHCFATLYSEKKQLDQQAAQADPFQGTCRLVALRSLRGDVVWDTDSPKLHELYKKLDFYDRNWTFSSPPLVKGERLYVGIATSPMGESESRVLCVDRRTGRPLWTAFLGSIAGRAFPMWGNQGRYYTYLTMLAEDGGVIYAHGNVGVAAAIHSVTGSILWLSKYPRVAARDDGNGWGRVMTQYVRPANPVILRRGRMYTLPQDAYEWQIFDMAKGTRLTPPAVQMFGGGSFAWNEIQQMIGIHGDWMALGGKTQNYVLVVEERKGGLPPGRCFNLVTGAGSVAGRAVLHGDTLYVPTGGEPGQLTTINAAGGSWKIQGTPGNWRQPGDSGNVLVAGDHLVVTNDRRATVYTDSATVEREFALRLAQSPPNPDALREYGELMRANGHLDKAARAYLAFIDAATGDPTRARDVRELKTDLHDNYMSQGKAALEEAVRQQRDDGGESARRRALECFLTAQGFAYDDVTLGKATTAVAETYDALAQLRKDTPDGQEFARKAVEEYQKLVEKDRRSHRDAGEDAQQPLWVYAEGRIRELRKAFGDAVYAPVEAAAREALRSVKDGSAEALKKVTELYPDTKAAREAWDRLVEDLEKAGDVKRLLSTLREMRSRFPERALELQKRITESLEKLFDWKRLSLELEAMAARHGDESLTVNGAPVKVRDYVTAKLNEISRKPVEAVAEPREPLRKLEKSFEALKPGAGRYTLPAGQAIIDVLGPPPPGFPADHEFFARGSSVELWDVRAGDKAVWSAPHPGGWLGATYEVLKDGGVKVKDVLAKSPAAEAKLQTDDVITAIGGVPARGDSFDLDIASAGPNARLDLTVQRKGTTKSVNVVLKEWPAANRPAVIGAAFTSAYELAVAWSDGVAGFDLATGRVSWVFRALRERSVIVKFAAVDGRLLLHEHYKDSWRSPMRDGSAAQQGRMEGRVICLDDASGVMKWARVYDTLSPSSHWVEFYAPYFASSVTVRVAAQQGGGQVQFTEVLAADTGAPSRRVQMGQGTMLATAFDASRGVLYSMDQQPNNNIHQLRATAMWGERAQKQLFELSFVRTLQGFLPDIAARGDWIAVLPTNVPQRGGQAKIVVVSARTQKEHVTITLEKGMHLPPSRALATISDDGVLYAYAVRDKLGKLLAWKLQDQEPKAKLLWESPAPLVHVQTGPSMWLRTLGTSVVLYAQSAQLPGESGQDSVAAEYAADSGMTRIALPQLRAAGGSETPVVLRRGRMYVNTAEALEVYGN